MWENKAIMRFKVPKIFDSTLLVAAFIVFISAIGLLTRDDLLFKLMGFTHGRSEIIAHLDSPSRDIRRRYNHELGWFPVKGPTEIYDNDAIFAGNGSQAEIQLKNGVILSLEPNTMVIIRAKDLEPEIEIKKGNIVATSLQTKKVNLLIQGKPVSLMLAEKDKTEIDAQGATPKINSPEVELISPPPSANIWKEEAKKVIFEWKPVSEANGYVLEIFYDKSQSEVLWKRNTPVAKIEVLSRDLSEGPIYWKVTASGLPFGAKADSHIQKLTILEDEAPTLVYPTDQMHLDFKLGESGEPQSFLFKWQSSHVVKSFHVQLAKDRDFKNLIYNYRIESTSAPITLAEQGSYFWRVKALEPDQKPSPWSVPNFFNINAKSAENTWELIQQAKTPASSQPSVKLAPQPTLQAIVPPIPKRQPAPLKTKSQVSQDQKQFSKAFSALPSPTPRAKKITEPLVTAVKKPDGLSAKHTKDDDDKEEPEMKISDKSPNSVLWMGNEFEIPNSKRIPTSDIKGSRVLKLNNMKSRVRPTPAP